MQKNLMGAEVVMKQMLTDGKVEPTDLLVFPLDRADGKVYQRRYSINLVPTLTTTNKILVCSIFGFSQKGRQAQVLSLLASLRNLGRTCSILFCVLFVQS